MSLRPFVLMLGVIMLLGSLTVAAVQIVLLERDELEHVSPWETLAARRARPGSTRISARLAEVELDPGEHTLFELCAQDGFEEARWLDAAEAVVWQPGTTKLELKVPFDAAHLRLVKRANDRACLTLGGGKVTRAGRYALDLVWAGKATPPGLFEVPIQSRVLARRPLGAREGVLVLSAALGALLTVLAGFVPRPRSAPSARRPTVAFAFVGTGLALALAAVVLRLPIPGSIGGLARGLGFAGVEACVAVGFAWWLYRSPRDGLCLHAPERHPGPWLLGAALCSMPLNPLARWAMDVVPATSEAPIEAFISWPSGALAFAVLGMAVPLAEELFFRGFVFGALAPLGTSWAALGTIFLFASAHVQQAWGNWGALLSVLATGVVLTILRAATGSTLVPAVAHLLYNLSLWKDSFAS